MVIRINPRISGGFVYHVMNKPVISDQIKALGLTEEQAHNLVKSIIITSMTDYEVDVNNIINRVRDSSPVAKKDLSQQAPDL